MFLTALATTAALGITPAEKKVLVIGIDGVYPPALERADTPHLDALLEGGCYTNRAVTGDVTVSGPGWSSLLCGVWRDKHAVPDNNFRKPNYEQYPSFFTLLKRAKPSAKTAAFTSWRPLHDYTLFDADVDHKVFHDYSDDDGDATNVRDAAAFLSHADVDAVFFYFADVDVAGHAHGFHSDVPEYIAEIEEVDAQVGALIAAIQVRPNIAKEDWLILSSTDHGGTLDGSHGRNEPKHREIYYLASGPSAARGEILHTVNQVDIAVTALAHLGVKLDPSWNLDGRVSGLPSPSKFDENLIDNGDAEATRGYRTLNDNAGIAGWIDLAGMTVIEYGGEGFPSALSPGPDDRGRNFFAGGGGGNAVATQRIDVSNLASALDSGEANFELEAWLGGYSDQRDLAHVTARFLDRHGVELDRATVGPVTLEDRRKLFGATSGERATGLMKRSLRGNVPSKTRIVEIILEAEVGSGGNDGYADNLSLVFRR